MKLSTSEFFAGSRGYSLVAVTSIGVSIALFAPIDVLQYTLPQVIVNVMSAVIPTIGRISKSYELTQVLQLFFSVMWMLSPILYYSVSRSTGTTEDALAVLKEKKVGIGQLVFVFLFFSTLLFSLGWIFIFGEHDPCAGGNQSYLMSHYRFGMAIYGLLIVFIEVMCVRVLVGLGGLLTTMYFSRSKK